MDFNDIKARKDWVELAHEEKGHIFPTHYYWRCVQLIGKLFDHPPNVFALYFTSKGFGWLTSKNALSDLGVKILKKFEQDKNFINKIVDHNHKFIPVLLKESSYFNQDLSQINEQELFDHYKKTMDLVSVLMEYSGIGTVLEFETPHLSNKLMGELTTLFGKEKAGEYFSILTLPTEKTSSQEEKLALHVLKLKKLNGEDVIELLKNHWKKYAWLGFNYDGPEWSFEDIKGKFNALSNSKEEILASIDELTNENQNRKLNQENLIKELKLSDNLQYLFMVLRTLGYWKFERKFQNIKFHYYLNNLMKEISKRFGVSLGESKMILPSEMEDVLVHSKIDKALLSQRCELCICLYQGYEDFMCLSGDDALEIEKDILKCLQVDDNVDVIKGSTAFKGKASGRVRIVNTKEDMEGFEEGDVLVSASTSPDIISAMSKAAAIVTDSGGITCHAAIVSRELKVPTIIGTGSASKILKNNEIVEVDANNGIVKRGV
tara:strand:- start:7049 stop:8518 length:1470 start_codon:yes stop_codon:yes gene_type:complete